MEFISINEQDVKLDIARFIIIREREVYSYQFNIDNYTSILSTLPEGDWPDNIVGYRGVMVDNLPESLSIEDIETINNYNYRDRLRYLIRTETIERNKSIKLLESLKSRLTSEELATLIEQVKNTTTV